MGFEDLTPEKERYAIVRGDFKAIVIWYKKSPNIEGKRFPWGKCFAPIGLRDHWQVVNWFSAEAARLGLADACAFHVEWF